LPRDRKIGRFFTPWSFRAEGDRPVQQALFREADLWTMFVSHKQTQDSTVVGLSPNCGYSLTRQNCCRNKKNSPTNCKIWDLSSLA